MAALGDFDASAVVYGKFTTYRPSTGAPFALAGSPALSVYKDNSTTQSTTGVTLTADFDSVAGLNHFAVDTSADGTFYSAGSFFDVVVTTGTVDGVSVVGSVVASFTIRKTAALKPATAGRTLVVDAAGLADANTVKVGPTGAGTAQTARDVGASVLLSSGTGTGQLKLASGYVAMTLADVAAPTTVVNFSGMTIKTATDIETDTQDIQSRLPAALVSGRMSSDMVAISGDTTAADNLETSFDDTAGAVPWQGIVDQGTAQAATGTTLQLRSAAAFANDEILGAVIVITGGSAGVGQARTITDYVSSTDTATVDAWTTTPTGTITYKILAAPPADATAAAIKIVTDKLDDVLEDSGGGAWIFTTAALANGPSGSGPSAADIADAVWDETLSGHAVSGSTGEALSAAGASGDPWITSLPGSYSAGQAGYIVGTNLNATVSSRAAASVLGAAVGASISADIAAVKSDSAAIKTKTDSLTFTVAGMVDSNVVDWKGATAPAMTGDAFARLGAPAGASVSADVAAIQSDTNDIQTRLPAALVSGRMDSSVGAMATGVVTATAIASDAITDAKVASDVTIASVTGAVGSVTGNVGGSVASVVGLTASDVGAIKAKTDLIPVSPAATGDIPTVDDFWDEAVDGSVTARQSLRLSNSALAGKASGLDTTAVAFRDLADTKDRITATVTADGNRTAVITDLT